MLNYIKLKTIAESDNSKWQQRVNYVGISLTFFIDNVSNIYIDILTPPFLILCFRSIAVHNNVSMSFLLKSLKVKKFLPTKDELVKRETHFVS